MCAICGIVRKNGPGDLETVKRMARLMDYRGPDAEGFFADECAVFGHRRLSIIDLGTGQQPMKNEDGTIVLIVNGEIYNFKELRKRLEEKGHRFRSNADSEVILHLYEEKGDECVRELRGMFSFAIWDAREKRLLLARDRVGKKPLVYGLINGGIVFSSELKALLLHPEIGREVDPRAVDAILTYQAIPSPATIFSGIRKLPPAHYLVWKDGQVAMERYWDVDFTKKIRLKNEDEYAELLWEKLTEATKLRMVSDVPLGAFLSGGIDSSAVVGLMSGLTDRPVKTFSIGFDVEEYSELPFARMVAERFGTDHREFVVKPDIIGILPKLVWHYNEPFGDSSMVPSYYVARETRKHVTVALNGDGGDESLGGYPRYRQTKILERMYGIYRAVPGGKALLGAMAKGYGRNPRSTFFRIWKWMEETEQRGFCYAYNRRLFSFSSENKRPVYSRWFLDRLGGWDAFSISEPLWEQAGRVDLLEKMLYNDFHLYLPEVLMVKMDIATMANSIEGRSPFLDHVFIETAASFPASLKLRGAVSKYILKKKLKGFLPDQIITRPKMGFGIPFGTWFRNELKGFLRETLLSDKALKRPYFNPEGVRRMVEEHIAGKAVHTHRLWNMVVFEMWNKVFVDGERP